MDREIELKKTKKLYFTNKLATWAGRIGGLAMIVWGAIEQAKGNDGRFLMACGALGEFCVYVVHPYKQINRHLKEKIDYLTQK